MAATSQFKDRGVIAVAQATVANTNLDGSTGTYVTVATGAAKGTVIERVLAKAAGTTTAGMLRLFVYDGSDARLVHELDVTALTPGGTQQAWSGQWVPTTSGIGELILPENYELRVSTHNAETFNLFAIGGDY